MSIDTNEVSEITRDDLDAVVNATRSHQNVKVVQENASKLFIENDNDNSNVVLTRCLLTTDNSLSLSLSVILLRNFTFSRTNIMVMEQNPFIVPLVRSAMSKHNDHFQGRADDLLRVLPAPNQ